MFGVPSLALSVGNGTSTNSSLSPGLDSTAPFVALANYTSGNGTSELLFAYKAEAGDATERLDYVAPGAYALSAPYASILAVDTLEHVYLRSLPEPGMQGSLGWNKNIRISDEVLLVERVSISVKLVQLLLN